MSDSIGMVAPAAAAVLTRPKDSNGFEIHSKEERIAAWNQSQIGAAARKADPSLWLSDMPPAERASMEAAMARSAEALRRAQKGEAKRFSAASRSTAPVRKRAIRPSRLLPPKA